MPSKGSSVMHNRAWVARSSPLVLFCYSIHTTTLRPALCSQRQATNIKLIEIWTMLALAKPWTWRSALCSRSQAINMMQVRVHEPISLKTCSLQSESGNKCDASSSSWTHGPKDLSSAVESGNKHDACASSWTHEPEGLFSSVGVRQWAWCKFDFANAWM